MRERGAVPVSSPQVGDFVLFTWSHVEIITKVENGVVYCAGSNNGSSTGYCKGEREVNSVVSTRLFLRPNYIINPTVPPSNPTISTNKSVYKIGEQINFEFSADNASEAYILIDTDGVRVEPWANVTGKTSYSCSFNEPNRDIMYTDYMQ